MTTQLTCTQCHKTFTAISPQQVAAKNAGKATLCSDECRKKYIRNYNNNHYHKNKTLKNKKKQITRAINKLRNQLGITPQQTETPRVYVPAYHFGVGNIITA